MGCLRLPISLAQAACDLRSILRMTVFQAEFLSCVHVCTCTLPVYIPSLACCTYSDMLDFGSCGKASFTMMGDYNIIRQFLVLGLVCFKFRRALPRIAGRCNPCIMEIAQTQILLLNEMALSKTQMTLRTLPQRFSPVAVSHELYEKGKHFITSFAARRP